MGSPYHLAHPIVKGDYIPDLSGYEFQDVAAVSPDGKDLYLVFWDLQGNYPAFRVLWLNEDERRLRISDRVEAACQELLTRETGRRITARVWDVFQGERIVEIAFPNMST